MAAPRFEVRHISVSISLPAPHAGRNQRVVPNGEGAELVFTLLRPARMNDQDWQADIRTVTRPHHPEDPAREQRVRSSGRTGAAT